MYTAAADLRNHILHMQIEICLAKYNGDPDVKITIWRQYYIPLLRTRLDRAMQREGRAA